MAAALECLNPALEPWARWLIGLWPYGQLTSTCRSRAEQSELYNAFLRGESRYPALPPGHSMHERGRAFDYLAPDEVLFELGRIWQYYGGRWGGPADPIHFEA